MYQSIIPELERQIRMSPTEFISSLGGLFGLCLGFSIASFFEIIYWFTIVLSRFLSLLYFDCCYLFTIVWCSGTLGEVCANKMYFHRSLCGRAQFQINAALLCTFVCWTTKTWRKGGNSARPLSKDIVVLSVKTNLFVCVDVAPKKTSPIQLWPRWNPWTPCI